MMSKKGLYKRKVLKHLYFADMLSCAELSVAIEKSLPVTTRLLNDLIKEGYVLESGQAPSTGGRRAAMYCIKKDVFYIVSVAADQFTTRIAVLNMQNKQVQPVVKMTLPLADNAQALFLLTEKIEAAIAASGINRQYIIGVGVGMPGFVDAVLGVNYTFLATAPETVKEYISRQLQLPVFIDNDSRLIALAELRFGVAREQQHAMVINIGWGIGLGMIVNGKLFRGHNGFAGELSHIPLFMNGRLCSCGKTGCLETETSLQIVIAKAYKGIEAGKQTVLTRWLQQQQLEPDADAIMNAAAGGDRFAVELLSEAGYNIGRGVAVLIHLMNPETIILSGRGSAAGKIWQAPIQQALNEHCIPRMSAHTNIVVSNLGHEAALTGAAALVMENYDSILLDDTYMRSNKYIALTAN
ncbi:Sugar kinase of the NBD/HSP70 family, may contain an N-terminal HTH domain [Filimonas lacunae]|uniref:Sugar kinase of the NBD/HSP70 family, may contain an N-terminal HTH domain n=1 Tax=Filimonas lacunae TaxID=477680 RepID=A0A173MGF1_9BACT|nr:ROK family protein [Filimonas lacunae]BAV06557.1 glucokinase [Filimonas lacunae]SIT27383.1 Sugar kinase of the NBD/HSP70 family, may contain an N-terminal HTH domain [Filimonas lacunae]